MLPIHETHPTFHSFMRRPVDGGVEVRGLLYDSPSFLALRNGPDAPPVVELFIDADDISRTFVTGSSLLEVFDVELGANQRAYGTGLRLDTHWEIARLAERFDVDVRVDEDGRFQVALKDAAPRKPDRYAEED